MQMVGRVEAEVDSVHARSRPRQTGGDRGADAAPGPGHDDDVPVD